MPCHAAAAEKFVAFTPGQDVESALKTLKKEKIELAPVVDKDGVVAGIFSLQILLRNLLPVSVAMSDGIQLDIKIGAAPGVAKRLKKVYPLPVSELMERKFISVAPDTPLWEGVNMLVQTGLPILIMDQKSGKAMGVITHQSMLDELNRMKDSE